MPRRTATLNVLKIEMDASTSNLTAEEYTGAMWSYLVAGEKKHQPDVKHLARELNVYPRGVNVYTALCQMLFAGIAIGY